MEPTRRPHRIRLRVAPILAFDDNYCRKHDDTSVFHRGSGTILPVHAPRSATYGLLEKSDVLSWAHWLRQQDCKALYALGESLGGSVLIQAAALGTDFRAIVAESLFADLQAIAEFRVRQMFHLPPLLQSVIPSLLVPNSMTYARLRYGIDLRQVLPSESIHRTATPILLIHGLRDSRTPCWHSQALARANANCVLWLVPNAEHTGAYSTTPTEFRRRVLGWFAEH
jgi:fermentation-respiration switch protein FrsA (DUF1100 family)